MSADNDQHPVRGVELAPRFAVVFKTHAWDEFVARQFERFRRAAGAGDVFIVADETSGPLGPIPHDRVIRTTNDDLVARGLANAFAKGGLVWWNTDYPNYLAYEQAPDYDYYLFVEYDTRINMNLDTFIGAVSRSGADLVALPIRQTMDTWYWGRFHEAHYPRAKMRASLNCISVLSNRALRLLYDRRREMTVEHSAGKVPFWPGNEVFLATEVAAAQFRFVSIEEFGDASGFEWHPPHLDEDLTDEDTRVFLHPVLDRKRYIGSVLKFEFDLSSYFVASSPLRRTLARFPAREYVSQLPGAFRRQITTKVRQALGAV